MKVRNDSTHAKHGSRRQVVIHELAVLHHPQGVRLVRSVDIWHDGDRDQASTKPINYVRRILSGTLKLQDTSEVRRRWRHDAAAKHLTQHFI